MPFSVAQKKQSLSVSRNLCRDQPGMLTTLRQTLTYLEDRYAAAWISAITIECAIFLPTIQQILLRIPGRFLAMTSNVQPLFRWY